jgi:hypothetical protein
MIGCSHLHDKLEAEGQRLMELCPNPRDRADFILGEGGRELCEYYCLTKCPDRFECYKYGADAK